MLGPLLFLVYINDFSRCVPQLDFHLFADDSNLLCFDKNLLDMKLKLNNQLNFVNEWLFISKLCLNVDKSNYVIFSSSQRKIHYSIKIFINLVKIKERKSIKYLGVIIDKNLKWKDHIHELSKKNCQEYWYIIKATAFCPKKHLSVVLLYHLARHI